MAYCLKCVLWCWGITFSNCAQSHVRRLVMLRAGTNCVWEKGRWLASPKLSLNRKLKQAGLGVNIHTKCFCVRCLQGRDTDCFRKEEEEERDHLVGGRGGRGNTYVMQILFEYSNLFACLLAFFLGLSFANSLLRTSSALLCNNKGPFCIRLGSQPPAAVAQDFGMCVRLRRSDGGRGTAYQNSPCWGRCSFASCKRSVW